MLAQKLIVCIFFQSLKNVSNEMYFFIESCRSSPGRQEVKAFPSYPSSQSQAMVTSAGPEKALQNPFLPQGFRVSQTSRHLPSIQPRRSGQSASSVHSGSFGLSQNRCASPANPWIHRHSATWLRTKHSAFWTQFMSSHGSSHLLSLHTK